MKLKKHIFTILLVVLLFLLISSVSATDINTNDTQTVSASVNDEILSVENDVDILGEGEYNYTQLKDQFRFDGDITLTAGNYTYVSGDGDTIEITTSRVIDGNGAVIDMANSGHRAFSVTTDGVTIKNLTIKNANYNGDGGAIYFSSSGTVENCNFTGNKATGDYSYGGAIHMVLGSVENCNFINNTVGKDGGAIMMNSGNVENCNFTANQASDMGGAIYFYRSPGTVTNCNFAHNSANKGGSILSMQWLGVTADTCIFKTSSDEPFNTRNLPPTLIVDNFTTVYGSGEKLTFDLRTNSSILVTNGNISISVYFKDNDSWVGNYNCLSGEGWTVNLPVGSYYAIFDTEYAEFQQINRTVTIMPNNTFWALNHAINANDNSVINLSNDYYFDSEYDSEFVNGVVINRPITINGNGHTIDALQKARIFKVTATSINITGLTFKNGKADNGGALYFSNAISNSNINATYINNTAERNGGANYFNSEVSNSNINGTYNHNTANNNGGANNFLSSVSNSNINGTYKHNTAKNNNGGANHFQSSVSNSNITGTYNHNTANNNGGANNFNGDVSNSNINGTYNHNTANLDGGANYFYWSVSNSNINGTYNHNTAERYGGANNFKNSVSNSNINGTYNNNTANLGDGGANNFQSSVSNSNINGTYNHNTANRDGGANNFQSSVSNSNITGTYINNTASNAIIHFKNLYNRVLDAYITNAIFLNNKCEYEIYAQSSGVVVKDSWFGNNASNYMNEPNNYNVQMDSWLFLNGTNNQNDIKFFLMRYDGTTTSEYDNTLLPKINLTLTTTDGTLDKSVVSPDETVKFNPTESGIKRVTAQIEDAAQTIEFTMGDFNILQAVINNATSSVINLTRNYTYNQWDTMTEGVLIDRNVTINGNGFTIDAKGKSRIFKVTAESINITDVTFKNGKADNGGAIYFSNAISNSNINATYINNTADWNGGANNFNGAVSTSNINGIYKNNTAQRGGANYFDSVSNSNITGTYNHNTANWNGGANYFYWGVSNSNINGTYKHNTAKNNNGGANYFDDEVLNSNITGTYNHNTANNNGGANNFNGAVSTSNITGTYNHNTANLDGGANYFTGTVSNSNITGTYKHNTANHDGGANYFIWTVSNSNINGTYKHNTANHDGGANYFTWTVSNSNINGTYINNTASNAIIHFENYYNQGLDAYITNAIFLNNKCEYEIYARTPGVVVKDSWFGNNASNYMNKPNVNKNIQIDNWLFLNATADYSSLLVMDSSNITFKLYSTNGTNVSDFDNSKLPVINLTLTATNGDVENTTTLDNIVKYRATEKGKGSVTAKIENTTHTIYFDNNPIDVDLSVSAQNITYLENEVLTLTYNNTATGKVNITLKSKNYNKKIECDINQTITIADLPAGDYDVVVEYFGDNVFLNATAYANFTVNKRTTEVIPDKETIELFVDEESQITYALKPDYAIGNISFSSDDSSIVSVDSASGVIVAKCEGSANITISFSGSENYTTSNATITVIVKRIPTQITVNSSAMDMKVNDEEDIGAGLEPADAGNLTYTVSNPSVVKVENGKITALKEGNVTITVSFAGDNKYASAENKTINVTVKKLNATMDVSADEITEGENAAISITLPSDATGNVTTTVNGKTYSSEVKNGKAVIIIPDLLKGDYTLPITYSGDDKYNPLTKDVNITVEGGKAIISAPELVKYYSGSERFVVNLTYAKGSPAANTPVNITINGVTYTRTTDENGIASLNINLGAGKYDVTVKTDDATTDSVVTVLSTINASDVESKTKNLVFTATFTDGEGNPLTDGTPVAFNIKGVIYNSTVKGGKGSASIDLTMDSGRYIITSFNPVSGENASNNIAVDLKDAEMILSGDEITVGENATISVTLPSDTTGNVTASVNGKTYTDQVNNGKANIIIPDLAAGNYTIPVTYSGDDKYNSASGETNITVNKANAAITIDAPAITVGENATVTVNLASDATGNVTIGNESVPVKDGTATAIIPDLPVGTNTIPVTYSGDDKYNSIETSADIIVNEKPVPAKENLTIKATADEITEGENATVIITGLENATGNVSVNINGKTYTAPINNGEATVTVPDLTENTTAVISYPGDDRYNSAVTTVNITVNRNTVTITAENLTKYYRDSEKFTVTVTDAKGQAASNKTVEITINGVTYKRTTDENGTAGLNINLDAGEYPVSIAVDNTVVNSTVTVKSTIEASDVVKMFRNDTQYCAAFTDTNGTALANTKVSFNINGIIYNRTTDANGTAKLNINMAAGDYIITATNPVTGEMKSNNIKVISLIESDDLTKYYRNASQFVVRIHSADGGYVGAGEEVKFNINGVFYTRTTNATGHAKLNINLEQGNYTITTYHKDCSQGNQITVLPVLSADDLVMKYRDGSQFKAKLVDGQGKAYAGQSIQFNIKGVFYTRTTGSDGIAKLNINLMAGEYIITSSYNGSNIANKITIRD